MAANILYGLNQMNNLVVLYPQYVSMDVGHHLNLPKDSTVINLPQRSIVPLGGIFCSCCHSSGVCPCLRRRCGGNGLG